MRRRDLLLAGLPLPALVRGSVDQAQELIDRSVKSREVTAAALMVRRSGRLVREMNPHSVFLLASITKPMTAAGVMLLRDRGAFALSDPVRKFIPEFRGGDRDRITVKHLLTHTSGLPDMLPENVELRKRHAPLEDFVAGTCRTPLLFPPGTRVQYQSMGILLAAEIAQRITRMPFREYLRREVFEPLEMKQASLGLGGRRISDTAPSQVPEVTSWDWNSPYWRDLGAPWGGAHSTAADVAKLLDEFARPKLFRPETAREMTTDQNKGLNEPWGLGWMLKPFGRKCSARTFGHWGVTGTVAWYDPAKELTCVLLTTKPAADPRDHLLGLVSDRVSEAA